MTREKDGAPATDAVRTAREADATPSGDSPKPHGDKTKAVGGAAVEASLSARPGDSPKPHGDTLARAVNEVVKGPASG